MVYETFVWRALCIRPRMDIVSPMGLLRQTRSNARTIFQRHGQEPPQPEQLQETLNRLVLPLRQKATVRLLQKNASSQEQLSSLDLREMKLLTKWWANQAEGSTYALALLNQWLRNCDNDNAAQHFNLSPGKSIGNGSVHLDPVVEIVVASWLHDYLAGKTDVSPSQLKDEFLSMAASRGKSHNVISPRVWEMVDTAVERRSVGRSSSPVKTTTDAQDQRHFESPILRRLLQQQLERDDSTQTSDTNLLHNISRINDGISSRLNDKSSRDLLETGVCQPNQRVKLGQSLEIILSELWKESENQLSLRPNGETYEFVMVGWLKTKPEPKRVSRYLHRLLVDLRKRIPDQLSQQHFRLLLSACARDGSVELALAALSGMKRLQNIYSKDHCSESDGAICADGKAYSTVLQAMAQQRGAKWVDRASELVQELLERNFNGEAGCSPEPHMYTSYLKIWSRSGRRDTAKRVQTILDNMENSDGGSVKPNELHYAIGIQEWIKVGDLEQAEVLLRQAHKNSLQLKPKVYLDLIKAWVGSGSGNDKAKAESVLVLMKQDDSLLREEDADTSGDPRNLLKILSKSKQPGDADLAESILRHIQSLYYRGHAPLKLRAEDYNAVIRAWSVSGSPDAPERAEALLMEILAKFDQGDRDLEPSEHTITSVITCWARSDHQDAGVRAQAVWDSVKQLCEKGTVALSTSVASYTALTRAWAQVGQPERAEIILQQMHEEHVVQGNELVRPSRQAFNTLITAWAQSSSPHAADRINQIIDLMNELAEYTSEIRPDVVSYSAAVSSLLQGHVEDSERRAEQFLKDAIQNYEDGNENCKPNSVLYGAVIQVLSRSDTPDEERVYTLMHELLYSEKLDDKQLQMAMCAVLKVFSESSHSEFAVLKAESLFEQQLKLSTSKRRFLPTLRVHTEMLKVYRNHCRPFDLRDRARRVFDEVRSQRIQTDEVFDTIYASCSSTQQG